MTFLLTPFFSSSWLRVTVLVLTAPLLAAASRRERQAPSALPLHVVEDVLAQAVSAQRGHAERDLMRCERIDRLAHEWRNRAVVRGRQRGQRRLVVAGFLQ